MVNNFVTRLREHLQVIKSKLKSIPTVNSSIINRNEFVNYAISTGYYTNYSDPVAYVNTVYDNFYKLFGDGNNSLSLNKINNQTINPLELLNTILKM